MLNINFVPDDYIQNSESRRTNLMYIGLFAVLMMAVGGSFMAIKIRQRAIDARENLINEKMARAKESIKQFEQLQASRKAMLKTALTTAELLEPVPRSILLASLTNNLPIGVSLLHLGLIQKEPSAARLAKPTSKYKTDQAKKAAAGAAHTPQERLLDTYIDIEGIAPSDLQVAAYIERLSGSILLDNVALVESKERKTKGGSRTQSSAVGVADMNYRQFKLTAMLKKDVQLSKEDISRVRARRDKAVYSF